MVCSDFGRTTTRNIERKLFKKQVQNMHHTSPMPCPDTGPPMQRKMGTWLLSTPSAGVKSNEDGGLYRFWIGQQRGSSHWFICNFGFFGRSFREVFLYLLICFSGSFRSFFDQIFDQVFDQIFGQGFDQGFGEGESHEYAVQYYPALRKTP